MLGINFFKITKGSIYLFLVLFLLSSYWHDYDSKIDFPISQNYTNEKFSNKIIEDAFEAYMPDETASFTESLKHATITNYLGIDLRAVYSLAQLKVPQRYNVYDLISQSELNQTHKSLIASEVINSTSATNYYLMDKNSLKYDDTTLSYNFLASVDNKKLESMLQKHGLKKHKEIDEIIFFKGFYLVDSENIILVSAATDAKLGYEFAESNYKNFLNNVEFKPSNVTNYLYRAKSSLVLTIVLALAATGIMLFINFFAYFFRTAARKVGKK